MGLCIGWGLLISPWRGHGRNKLCDNIGEFVQFIATTFCPATKTFTAKTFSTGGVFTATFAARVFTSSIALVVYRSTSSFAPAGKKSSVMSVSMRGTIRLPRKRLAASEACGCHIGPEMDP